MVGVIVIGIIAATISATVFAVIPWTQDEAAKSEVRSVVDAQRVYRAMTPSPSGSGVGRYSGYGTLDQLVAAHLLPASPRLAVRLGTAQTCFAAAALSATGHVFYATTATPEVRDAPGGIPEVDCDGASIPRFDGGIPVVDRCAGPAWTPADPQLAAVVRFNTGKSVDAPLTIDDARALVDGAWWEGLADFRGTPADRQTWVDAGWSGRGPTLSSITNLEGVECATKLEKWAIYGAASGTEWLTGLPLTWLDFHGAPAASYDVVPTLTKLQHVNAQQYPLADLTVFAGATGMRDLSVAPSTTLTSIHGVEGMTGLEEFYISYTQVADLGPLSGIHNLRVVEASGTLVTTTAPLAGSTKLESLSLINARLTTLTGVETMTGLRSLGISGNAGLTSVEQLRNLPSLDSLDAAGTGVTDWTPTTHIPHVGR